jgi:hypothetical protein
LRGGSRLRYKLCYVAFAGVLAAAHSAILPLQPRPIRRLRGLTRNPFNLRTGKTESLVIRFGLLGPHQPQSKAFAEAQ